MLFKLFKVFCGVLVVGLVTAAAQTTDNDFPCGNGMPGGPEAPCDDSGGGDGCPECEENSVPTPKNCSGPNPFHAFSGNVKRVIDDLEVWGGVGEHQLVWRRIGNSRAPGPFQWLGTAGNWRHSYQWEIVWDGAAKSLDIYYPDETLNRFIQSETNPAEWRSTPSITDILFQNQSGDEFTLQRKSGWRYHFVKLTNPNGSIVMRLQDFTDSQGNLYKLSYLGKRLLDRIEEPAGRFLQLNWTNIGKLHLISKVFTSDGRSVSYEYVPFNDTNLTFIYQALTNATYGDSTQANYTYEQILPLTRPLLTHAIDPRFKGQGVNIKYDYFKTTTAAFGTVKSEINGTDDKVIATLSIANGNAFTPQVESGNGAKTIFGQGRSGSQLQKKIDGLGRKTIFAYEQNGFGFLASSQDALGRSYQFINSRYGNWLQVTYPDTSFESWTRDDLELMVTHTDELGRITIYTRDAQHRISQIEHPDHTFEKFTYNDFGQVLTHTLRNGSLESYAYDERQLKVGYTNALGFATTYTYDSADRLASMTDARMNTTQYEYDERGLSTRLTHCDGSFRSYGYDSFGNRTSETNEIGKVWLYTYDEFRRLTSQTDPLNRTTTYGYGIGINDCPSCHVENKPTEIIRPSQKTTRIGYDLEWQKTAETNGFGTADAAITKYDYDAAGNLTTITDPNTHTWMFTYDSRNRRASAADPIPNTTTWIYDAVGNVKTNTRPDLGQTIYNDYDPMNRLLQVTDPKQQVTKFTYDAEGNLKELTDAKNHVYTFEYDLLNRRTKLKYPPAGDEQVQIFPPPPPDQETWSYDGVGNVLTYTTRAGQVMTYTNDCRNRETFCNWSDGTPDVSKSYDFANRLLTLSSSVSALTYNYDDANELLSETQDISGAGGSKTLFYNYDSDGNRMTLTYPDGTRLDYHYTDRNQLKDIVADGPPPLVTYTYDLAGNRIQKTLENGTSADYFYDPANRVTSLEHRVGLMPFARFDYNYDSVNRRKFVKREDGKGDIYSYDAVDQVTGVQYDATNPDSVPVSPSRVVAYAHDAVGNRTTVTQNGMPTSYTANNLNQYVHVDAAALTYEANGNLKTRLIWNYTYDAQNRFVRADNGQTMATFAYDGRNRCVKRIINGETTFFYFDGWSLIEERDQGDTVKARYVHGALIDELLVRVTDASHYYHHECIGNVTHLTDASGTVVERYSYDIFGKATVMEVSPINVPNRFLFTGREYLFELSLYDYRNRSYWPDLGRFLQTDPVKFPMGNANRDSLGGQYQDGLNLYTYAGNSPVNRIDPSGTTWQGALCRVACAAAGAGLGAAIACACGVGDVFTLGGVTIPCVAVVAAGFAGAATFCSEICPP